MSEFDCVPRVVDIVYSIDDATCLPATLHNILHRCFHCVSSCLSSLCIILPQLACPCSWRSNCWVFACLRNPRFEHPCGVMGMSEFKISLRMPIGGTVGASHFHSLKVVAMTRFFVGFLPRTLLSILSEDCICFFIVWSGTLGTSFLRRLQCIRHVLVVSTRAWNSKIGIVAYFVGFCFQGMFSLIKKERQRSKTIRYPLCLKHKPSNTTSSD